MTVNTVMSVVEYCDEFDRAGYLEHRNEAQRRKRDQHVAVEPQVLE